MKNMSLVVNFLRTPKNQPKHFDILQIIDKTKKNEMPYILLWRLLNGLSPLGALKNFLILTRIHVRIAMSSPMWSILLPCHYLSRQGDSDWIIKC